MSEATNEPKTFYRRRKKLIRMDLQLKIVFITLLVASLVLLVNFQLTLAGLWSISSQLTESSNVDDVLEFIRSSTIQKFLFSVVMAVPLAGFVGILYSFKFCGPIYRFNKYFTELRTKRWDERCMLRKGDDLQDVCDSINGAMDEFRERIREDHRVLQDVKAFLDRAVFTSDSTSQELLAKVKVGIESEEKFFKERFPADEEASLRGEEHAPAASETAPVGGTTEENVPASQQRDVDDDFERELEAQS